MLAKDWAKHKHFKPNPPATDESVVRRAYLDTRGKQISYRAETEDFPPTRSDKSSRLSTSSREDGMRCMRSILGRVLRARNPGGIGGQTAARGVCAIVEDRMRTNKT